MENISYNYTSRFSLVEDLAAFWQERLPEIPRIKTLMMNVQLLFNLPSNRVMLEVAEGQRIYKVTFMTPDVEKIPFGWVVYLPQIKQIDLYSVRDAGMPMVQWKNKKIVTKNFDYLFERAGIETIFNKLVNSL